MADIRRKPEHADLALRWQYRGLHHDRTCGDISNAPRYQRASISAIVSSIQRTYISSKAIPERSTASHCSLSGAGLANVIAVVGLGETEQHVARVFIVDLRRPDALEALAQGFLHLYIVRHGAIVIDLE